MSKQSEDIALGNWRGRAAVAEARIAELEAELKHEADKLWVSAGRNNCLQAERDAALSHEAGLRKALEDAPIISKYHGHHGFEVNRFIEDYAAWTNRVCQALSAEAPDFLAVVRAAQEHKRARLRTLNHQDTEVQSTLVVLLEALAALDGEDSGVEACEHNMQWVSLDGKQCKKCGDYRISAEARNRLDGGGG